MNKDEYKKTKTMVVRRNIKEVEKINISAKGSQLEQVEIFIYLGQLITLNGKREEEVKRS